MPRAPKPKEMRQNTERVDMGEIPDDSDALAAIEVPKPPRTWLEATKSSWIRYWSSPARHVTVASLDMDTLERLWTLYDERTRAQRELAKARIVDGSQGQPRPSGFYMVISRLDAEIRQLEDRVAKHMKSRLTLGLRVGGDDRADEPDQPRDTAADDLDDDLPGQDPRLYVVGGNAG